MLRNNRKLISRKLDNNKFKWFCIYNLFPFIDFRNPYSLGRSTFRLRSQENPNYNNLLASYQHNSVIKKENNVLHDLLDGNNLTRGINKSLK